MSYRGYDWSKSRRALRYKPSLTVGCCTVRYIVSTVVIIGCILRRIVHLLTTAPLHLAQLGGQSASGRTYNRPLLHGIF